jgi:hypothetical protein
MNASRGREIVTWANPPNHGLPDGNGYELYTCCKPDHRFRESHLAVIRMRRDPLDDARGWRCGMRAAEIKWP